MKLLILLIAAIFIVTVSASMQGSDNTSPIEPSSRPADYRQCLIVTMRANPEIGRVSDYTFFATYLNDKCSAALNGYLRTNRQCDAECQQSMPWTVMSEAMGALSEEDDRRCLAASERHVVDIATCNMHAHFAKDMMEQDLSRKAPDTRAALFASCLIGYMKAHKDVGRVATYSELVARADTQCSQEKIEYIKECENAQSGRKDCGSSAFLMPNMVLDAALDGPRPKGFSPCFAATDLNTCMMHWYLAPDLVAGDLPQAR